MLAEHARYGPGRYMERWAFDITSADGRHVGTVRFLTGPKRKRIAPKIKQGHW
jgi:hypothetical protein